MATTYTQTTTSAPVARTSSRGVYIGIAAAVILILGILYAMNRPAAVDSTIPMTSPAAQTVPDGAVPPPSATMERGADTSAQGVGTKYPESTSGTVDNPSGTGTSPSDNSGNQVPNGQTAP